jgi:hypothetical protein
MGPPWTGRTGSLGPKEAFGVEIDIFWVDLSDLHGKNHRGKNNKGIVERESKERKRGRRED